jgi:hypothetical protein
MIHQHLRKLTRKQANLSGAHSTTDEIPFRDTRDNPRLSPIGVLRLQRTVGNQAVLRMLSKHAEADGKSDTVAQRKMREAPGEHDLFRFVANDMDPLSVKMLKTNWGTVWWPTQDESNFSVIDGFWDGPHYENGIVKLGVRLKLRDWRHNKLGSTEYLPYLSLNFSFRHQQNEADSRHDTDLVMGSCDAHYHSDGGGPIRVTAYYDSEANWNGRQKDYKSNHILQLAFTYVNNPSDASDVDVMMANTSAGRDPYGLNGPRDQAKFKFNEKDHLHFNKWAYFDSYRPMPKT